MAKPISAFFKAGASLLPSPVAATIYFNFIKPATNVSLSSGLALANTLSYLEIFTNLSKFSTPLSFLIIFSSSPSYFLTSIYLILPTNSMNFEPSITV